MSNHPSTQPSTTAIRAKVHGFGLYHLTVALLLGVAIGMSLLLGIILTSPVARAAEGPGTGYIETSAHGVVLFSSLPHCANDGVEVQPVMPCTWNVGQPTDGNGLGRAYILERHRHGLRVDYVWATNPVRNGWHWERNGHGPTDCVVKAGRNYERCADGKHRVTS